MFEAEAQNVVLTRAKEDNIWLARELKALKFNVLEAPALQFKSIEPDSTQKKVLSDFAHGKFEIVVFSSKHAVQFFSIMIKANNAVEWPLGCRIAAVGERTAAACKKYFGRSASIIGSEGNARSLVRELLEQSQAKHILLLKPQKSLPQIEFEFQKLGTRLVKLDCYQTLVCVSSVYAELLDSSANTQPAIFVFFSPSALQSSLDSFGFARLKAAKIVTIGQTTSRAVGAAGLDVWQQAKETSEVGVLAVFRQLLAEST
jgi:uroporphyrinogen-III synthase